MNCKTCNDRQVVWTGRDLGAHGPDALVDCPDCSEKGKMFAKLIQDIRDGKFSKSMRKLVKKQREEMDD